MGVILKFDECSGRGGAKGWRANSIDVVAIGPRIPGGHALRLLCPTIRTRTADKVRGISSVCVGASSRNRTPVAVDDESGGREEVSALRAPRVHVPVISSVAGSRSRGSALTPQFGQPNNAGCRRVPHRDTDPHGERNDRE